MNYNIIIYISRNNLSFYFSQNKSSYKIYEFENESLIPLCFYSEGSQFDIGHSAKLKIQGNYPKTYDDYFNLIKDTGSSFEFFNKEKKYKDLLVVGIEYLMNRFLEEIEITSDRVADIREKINLSLVFASDIKQHEINFVGELFKGAGYKNLKLIYYNYLLLNYLDKFRRIGAYKDDQGKIGAFKGYLLIDGLDNNLYIDFYNELSSKTPKFKKTGEDLANDPKDKIIAKILFDLAVIKSGSKVKEKSELIRLLPLAKKYSSSSKSEPLITVELSDGSVEKVRLKMKKVKEILSYESNFTKDFDTVKECEQKSKVTNIDLLVVVKRSITSINFLDKIKSHYNNVYHYNEEIEEVFELFISSPDVIDFGDFMETRTSKSDRSPKQKKTNSELPIPPPIVPLTNTTKQTRGKKPPTQPPKRVEVPSRPKPPPPLPKRGVVKNKVVKSNVNSNLRPSAPKPPPPPKRAVVTNKASKSGGNLKLKPPPPIRSSGKKKK